MTGRGDPLPRLSRVGLIGGSPYHRDLLRGWLADARCVLSITPIVNGHRPTHRPHVAGNGNGNGRADRRIDLVVGVINGPDDPTLDSCRQLTDTGRALPFVAVLPTPDRRVLQAALDAGAGGLVAATSGSTALAEATAAVAGGAAWLDPALSHIVIERMAHPAHDDRFGLTPMEQRVTACFGDGLTNREIADRLGIGEETVKSHVSNIYRKLDVSDRASAVTLVQSRFSTAHGNRR